MIKPSGPLMVEHRLIEKMVGLLKKELVRVKKTKSLDPAFIDSVVDFFCVYADRTHHDKEEDVLFRKCAKKPLSEELRVLMVGLVDDHVFARSKVGALADARDRFVKGDKKAVGVAVAAMDDLVKLYPVHISKEDKVFFPAVMRLFSLEEQQAMVDEFFELDRSMIHTKYMLVVEGLSR